MNLLFENWRKYLVNEGIAAYVPRSSERKMNKAIKELEIEIAGPEYKSTWDKIKQEIKETGEAYEILKKSFRQKLTDEEKGTLWMQINDLAKGTALGAIFATPGGLLLVPFVIKFIGDSMLPSAFKKEKEI